MNMKKCILMLSCAVALLLCGCGKDDNKGDEPVIDPVEWTWTSLVKEYPFLSGFPEFHGDVENPQYRDLSGLKTVTFFDYKCSESVATTYYTSLSTAGFSNNEGTTTYRKKSGNTSYTFTGGYSGGNFALSFSAENN